MYQKLLINQEIPQWVIFHCLDLNHDINNSKDANSVECKVRNPHWVLYKRLFILKYSYSCIKTAFSNIFENAGNSDIGL